ncbi:hypothetical protein EUTSA_v10013281mg [Eutrema salsugineum]|uniref:Protein kinase domain-containing protein n=1 Tax=Eutrema salsugineum TaxID=72664 RepID=V4LJC9_EUTSA|nr:probable inactive receptor-like protein kinase At3g56050 isoform X2 [Eutrema salsugineum]ESQ42522.1 hypothetical protein EUTSA_v10013281mg [Eutrema salsugineum]
MSSDGRWRFNLRTAFTIVFLTFLPLKLNTQEVFDSSQDHFLIQSEAYVNHRSLVETPLPGKDPALSAFPPSPDQPTTFRKPSSPPETQTPPGGDGIPSPPPSSVVPTQIPLFLPSPQPQPPPLPQPQHQPQSPPPGTKKKSLNPYMIVGIVVGVFTLSVALIIFFLVLSRNIPIKPWTSSGQLQDALITDVPRLQLSELQAACEDFSNIIGSVSDGTIYKGTLSTGAEVAVLSVAASSRADWSTAMEKQFLEKVSEPRLRLLNREQRLALPLKNISALFLQVHNFSKVDHKNFLQVIGYCHEDEPFNRMLVFEYAPNGSLSDHLHSQHAEHLDWPTRLRIAMGIAYCLEHMHNLNPPILHTNLDSTSVYLAEDNAAKVSDFSVLNCISPSKECSSSKNLLENSLLNSQTNVLNFGALVFEIISRKLPDPDFLLLESKPERDLVDPTLKTFQEDVVERLLEVVRQCMNPYSAQRPTMREVVVKLREITGITADAAMPRPSPQWWTELEIITTEGT